MQQYLKAVAGPWGSSVPRSIVLLLVAILGTLLCACGANDGLPSRDGDYSLQNHSVTWDGDQYRFYWADAGTALHQAHGRDFKLVQDDRSFLRVDSHRGILHLLPSDPVVVLGQDRSGEFSDAWFPFLLGATVGNVLAGPRVPTYYYPPTDVFGRTDELHGSVTSTTPKPPDYSTIKPASGAIQPASGSVSGQNAGTGGGNAAANKTGGSAGGVSGQAGGTGAGGAASNKGGFRSGGSSYTSRSTGSSGTKGGGSFSGGKGISGAGSGGVSAPSRPVGGGSRGRR